MFSVPVDQSSCSSLLLTTKCKQIPSNISMVLPNPVLNPALLPSFVKTLEN